MERRSHGRGKVGVYDDRGRQAGTVFHPVKQLLEGPVETGHLLTGGQDGGSHTRRRSCHHRGNNSRDRWRMVDRGLDCSWS
jgi:hypothetical protein